MNHPTDTRADASTAASVSDPGRAHHADGDGGGHECEFCSPEPQILPLPRSGAARTALQQPSAGADDAIGELLS